jgi:hypothetical protein
MPSSLGLTCENPRLKTSLFAHFSRVGGRRITQMMGTVPSLHCCRGRMAGP